MEVNFVWDWTKEGSNIRKHGVSFREAATVFDDDQGITIFDPDHSEMEDRFILFGSSDMKRLLLVVHTDRHKTIRIISARELTRRERSDYEKEIIRRQGL